MPFVPELIVNPINEIYARMGEEKYRFKKVFGKKQFQTLYSFEKQFLGVDFIQGF